MQKAEAMRLRSMQLDSLDMDIHAPLMSDYVEQRGGSDVPLAGKNEHNIDADAVRMVEKPPLIVPELKHRKHVKEDA